MKLTDFDYDLPEELIAQYPLEKRDSSRLLVLNKLTGEITHRRFFDVIEYLNAGDTLVLNDTKVFPARLLGQKKDTGGKVEILLNKEILKDSPFVIPAQAGIQDDEFSIWEVLGKNIKVGNTILFERSLLRAEVMKKYDEVCEVKFNLFGDVFFAEIEKIGHTPLPPYIKHADTSTDKKEYQTVYADKIGSVAAPTAGLHFTKELLEKIKSKGIIIAKVTLNVGLGTFAPVKEEKIEDHKIHSEYYSVDKNELKKIINAKKEDRQVIAVGTTSTRVLETIFSHPEVSAEGSKGKILHNVQNDIHGETKIFIYPGYKFKCIDGLITNFHLPKSTLLMLVSAFAGKKNIGSAYKEAIKQNYRFFSYGDAMFIF